MFVQPPTRAGAGFRPPKIFSSQMGAGVPKVLRVHAGNARMCRQTGSVVAVATRPAFRTAKDAPPVVLERAVTVEEAEQLFTIVESSEADAHAAQLGATASLGRSLDLDVSVSSMDGLDDDAGISGLHLPPAITAIIERLPARVRGLILLNLLVLLVASNWVVVKSAGTSFDPFYFAALRFGVAAAALSPFALRALRHKHVMRAGVELGLITAVGYLCQSQGLLTTDASRASFLSTFTVLAVPILVGLSGRGVKPAIWACAAAALFGVSLLEQSGAPPSVGDLWSVASAFAFGLQMFRTEHWSRQLSSKFTIHLMSIVLAVTAGAAAAAAAATHPAAFLEAVQAPIEFVGAITSDRVPWNEVLYTGLLSTDVALLMEVVALRDVASSEAAIVYTLEPVLGAAIAFAVLGERWGPSGWAGAGIIVGSSLFTQIYVHEEGEPKKSA